jgi:hypothetical protein
MRHATSRPIGFVRQGAAIVSLTVALALLGVLVAMQEPQLPQLVPQSAPNECSGYHSPIVGTVTPPATPTSEPAGMSGATAAPYATPLAAEFHAERSTMNPTTSPRARNLLATSILMALTPVALADVITDWNQTASALITESKIGTPAAIRVMALVQTAVSRAVDAAERRPGMSLTGASVDAAVAAANREALVRLLPAQKTSIMAAYNAALGRIPDGPAKHAGAMIGERHASAVLSARAHDDAAASVAYRPHAAAGAYVPTVLPAIPQWPQRKPWLLGNAARFRPAPPPALTSDQWAREYNEVKELGGTVSTRRNAEQTEIARFWGYSLPAIYYGVVRSVAVQPGRNVARNARLYAMASQAMDDAMIGVFEAKYHYNFWRPVTAIRNGDIDGHDGTQRDAGWSSLIEAPVHPEYPSGHSILAAAVGAVLKADLGTDTPPTLSTSSPTAQGASRSWARIDDFVREVSDARIYAGIHYRAATVAGETMGQRIGELAASKLKAAGH